MGHLGNPTAFRLGIQKNWNFIFFVKNLHYSELFHGLIHVKDYIHYYFSKKLRFFNQGAIFFSHLNIFKLLKKIYIKIYIYCAELERSSYNCINSMYTHYYDCYNETMSIWMKNNYINSNNIRCLREISNSDLGVFYISYVTFYQGPRIINTKKKKKVEIGKNKIKDRDTELNKRIVAFAIKESNINVNVEKKDYNNKKIKKNIEYKLKDSMWLKDEKNRALIDFANYSYLKVYFFLLKRKWSAKTPKGLLKKQFKNTNLSKHYYKKWFNRKKRDKDYIFFKEFYKKYRALCNSPDLVFLFQKDQSKFNLRETLIDKRFSSFFDLVNNLSGYNILKNIKLNFIALFLYLAKKVGFKKVKNSRSLRIKWVIILVYFKFFYRIGLINTVKNKKNTLTRIRGFFYLMSTFIMLSRKSFKEKTRTFNLRNAIYNVIYYGIFKDYIHPMFVFMTKYFKLIFTILLNFKFDKNTISIAYYMIDNANVTSRLIASYIALKLSKNVPIRRILNPLKFELIRVSCRSRSKYSITNMRRVVNKLIMNRSRFLKAWLKKYIHTFYCWIKVFSSKYYKGISGGILITLNFFYYRLNIINDIKKSVKNFYKKRVLSLMLLRKLFIYYRNKLKIFNLLKLLNKYSIPTRRILLIRYKLNLMYPMLLNLNNYNWKMNLMSKKNYYNNLFYYVLQTTYNVFFYPTYKLINTKLIYIGSFFIRNFINYKLIQDMWLFFNNFNLRNLRQKYITRFKTSLYGFKIVVKGRFSRKQRASKVSLNIGKVPLNTGDAKIDYSFFTLPIKNSAVSVKVYLYKNANYVPMYKNIMSF